MASIRHGRTSIVGLVLAFAGLLAATTISPAVAVPEQPVRHEATPRYTSCATPSPGTVHCFSRWTPTTQQKTLKGTTTSTAAVKKPKDGLGPADIRKAYKLAKKGKKGQTIGIVDAFDNPRVEADLKAYRAAYKLPACTTANHCFRKVDQRGTKKYPVGDPGWGVEIALDVQAVSASCPTCKILLVEADDDSLESIGAAVNTAVRLGATVVSNSYGTDEFASMVGLGKKYYTHPGVPIVASSGDYGFTAASFPAVLKSSWAVGGTWLKPTKSGGWTEDAWELAGSGCSAYIPKPSVQKDKNCSMRTVSDVSAVADSAEGFAVYDTYGLGEDNGWIAVGGTSLSAPLISGMIGMAGNAKTVANPSYLYTHRKGLKDVKGGSNGYCGGDYLCTGVKGYDGPTGLGSPRGLKSL